MSETDDCAVCGNPVEADTATGDATITAEGIAHEECATHDEVDVLPDGGLSTRTLCVGSARTVAYGPAGANSDQWALRFTTDDGERVTVRFDEPAMYELWTEVHNVPWPNREDDRHDLQREIVARAERADAETLRDVLDVLGGDPV